MGEKYERALSHIDPFVSIDLFEKYIVHSEQNHQELFDAIRAAQCDGLPRFNVWRMLLEVIPIQGDWAEKERALSTAR